jgi:endonuclease/exonuclease/phosphatase family metal-dependent hydrolase
LTQSSLLDGTVVPHIALSIKKTPMDENNQQLVAELGRYKNMRELRRSAAFQRHEASLRRLFNEPRTYSDQSVQPRLSSFLRVAAWNIECGKRFDGIVHALNTDPLLRYADLVLLSEVDDGMARSGNRSVASELAREISAHAVYGVEYLELCASAPMDGLPQENTSALHGNAILTRHDFARPRLIRLPRCEKNFESPQKRLGGRIGLIVELEAGPVPLIAGTTHLDVVNTPRCRQNQLRALLRHLDAGSGLPAIIGGDLNTHTFSRGAGVGTVRNLGRLLVDPLTVARTLLSPQRLEPALGELERFGFRLDGFNDELGTCRVDGSELLAASGLPDPLKRLVRRRFGSRTASLDFRLDWLAGRGLKVLGCGEVVDTATGVASVSARTIIGLQHRGCPVSDHDPVVADIAATPILPQPPWE